MDKVSQTVWDRDRVRYQVRPGRRCSDEVETFWTKIYLDLNLLVASYNPFDEFWSTTDKKFVCKLDLVRVFVV